MPSGRAVRPEAASSVGPRAIHYWASLSPCLGTAIAPRHERGSAKPSYDPAVRVVLVHGSVGNGPSTWGAVRPLGERFELVVPNRGGYPPNPPLERIDLERQAGAAFAPAGRRGRSGRGAPPRGAPPPTPPLERIDFERQADELLPLLDDGAHLVGHSYGGVIALLMAAGRPGGGRWPTGS